MIGLEGLALFVQAGRATTIGEGVHERDHSGGISRKRVASDLVAMVHQGAEVLEEGKFAAGALNFCWIRVAGLADDIGGGLGLDGGTVADGLGLEVVLVTAEAPIAEVVLVKVLAERAEFMDDDLIGEAVIEHEVDFIAEGGGQAGDFAVAAGPGLTGF